MNDTPNQRVHTVTRSSIPWKINKVMVTDGVALDFDGYVFYTADWCILYSRSECLSLVVADCEKNRGMDSVNGGFAGCWVSPSFCYGPCHFHMLSVMMRKNFETVLVYSFPLPPRNEMGVEMDLNAFANLSFKTAIMLFVIHCEGNWPTMIMLLQSDGSLTR